LSKLLTRNGFNQPANSKSGKDRLSSRRSDTASDVGGNEGVVSTGQPELPEGNRSGSGKDLIMDLAVELAKFIEELEYQLDFIVPMGELSYVCTIDVDIWSLLTRSPAFTTLIYLHSFDMWSLLSRPQAFTIMIYLLSFHIW